jgi:hypothetical protein
MQTAGRKIIAESLSLHDEKHVVPTPLSRIRTGRRRIFVPQIILVNCKCIRDLASVSARTSSCYLPRNFRWNEIRMKLYAN